jgi:hypothetical protein
MISFFFTLCSFVLVFNFTLFYLDDFRLSKNQYIKFMQILSPLFILLFIILSYYESMSLFNNILFVDDPNKNPNISIGARVEIGKEAATEISKGISSVGSNVGLAGTVGAVSAGVAKVVSKSSIPPMQKAGMVIGGAIIGGGIHIAGSGLNRLNSGGSSNNNNNISSNNENISKLIDDSNNSGLNDLILGIDMITYACFSLMILLSLMIFFKFYLDENKIKLNLYYLVGDKLNNNLEYYLIKLIKLNKITNNIYILILLVILLVGLGFNCYFVTELYNNLDKFIDLHISNRK